MIRVLLADDQSLVRAGFRLLLETSDGIAVAGEAANGVEAVALATSGKPDVVLMDIRMPEMDGLEATRRITSDPELANVRVIILTTFEADEYVFEALRVGASGFLLKDIDPPELLRAVQVVAAGEALLSPSVTRRLIAEFAGHGSRPRRPGDALKTLTDREREVLALVASGQSNDEIAKALYVSPSTVKTHVSRSMSKLEARDRAQLVIAAYENGLIVPGD